MLVCVDAFVYVPTRKEKERRRLVRCYYGLDRGTLIVFLMTSLITKVFSSKCFYLERVSFSFHLVHYFSDSHFHHCNSVV